MALTDSDGGAITAANDQAVAAWEHFVTGFLGFRPDTMDRLEAVEAADPDMPMVHLARGLLFKMMGSRPFTERARAAAAEAARRMDGATAREAHYAKSLALWLAGDMEGATAAWEAILLEHPRDAFALRLAHFTHFYSGDGRRIRDSLARVLPDWTPEHRNYGFVQGMYAFGLEESGDYGTAEHWGRAAVERNPADAWSVHSVAHVLEMTGRPAEGVAFVDSHERAWTTTNNFRFHLYWHRSLYNLELGQTDAALDIYDRHLEGALGTPYYLDVCNASSLLWRLEAWGVDVGDRWATIADLAEAHAEDDDLIFVSLHYLMALVSHGDPARADAMIERIAEWADRDTTQGHVVRSVGLDVAEGLRAHRRGDYAACLDRLDSARYRWDPLGGSHAQRDVFEIVMLDAARRSGQTDRTARLFRERTARKPSSPWTTAGLAAFTPSLAHGH